jgi:hypothetical protein
MSQSDTLLEHMSENAISQVRIGIWDSSMIVLTVTVNCLPQSLHL